MSKSSYYEYLRKYNLWKNKISFGIDKFILKSTRPINIKYKYSNFEKEIICNRYFNYNYSNLYLKPSIIQVTNKLKYEWNYKSFKNLSYSTTYKFIRNDSRYIKSKETYKKRRYESGKVYKNVGDIQFDLKIIGPKETHFGESIILATMKDEASKYSYGDYLESGTAENAIKVLEKGYEYFKEIGIQIKRIRTDNAMMFKSKKQSVSNYKKINFIYANIFHKFLKEKI